MRTSRVAVASQRTISQRPPPSMHRSGMAKSRHHRSSRLQSRRLPKHSVAASFKRRSRKPPATQWNRLPPCRNRGPIKAVVARQDSFPGLCHRWPRRQRQHRRPALLPFNGTRRRVKPPSTGRPLNRLPVRPAPIRKWPGCSSRHGRKAPVRAGRSEPTDTCAPLSCAGLERLGRVLETMAARFSRRVGEGLTSLRLVSPRVT